MPAPLTEEEDTRYLAMHLEYEEEKANARVEGRSQEVSLARIAKRWNASPTKFSAWRDRTYGGKARRVFGRRPDLPLVDHTRWKSNRINGSCSYGGIWTCLLCGQNVEAQGKNKSFNPLPLRVHQVDCHD